MFYTIYKTTNIINGKYYIGKQTGKKNSQYGTCWITNGSDNKKIKKIDLDNYSEMGYYKGRIIK